MLLVPGRFRTSPAPAYFAFNDQIWSVEEREATKLELPDHQTVLYFRSGKRARWTTHTRATLKLYSPRDLRDLLLQAKPVPDRE